MNVVKGLFFFLLLNVHFIGILAECDEAVVKSEQQIQKEARTKKKRLARRRATHDEFLKNQVRPYRKKRVTHMLGHLVQDAFWINAGLFSWDSFKVIITTVPFFVGARMIDEKLHNCFFDHVTKKNKNEPAQWCKEIARLSIGVPIALLGFQSVLSRDEDMRTTSQIFLIGMPFVLLAKDVIKKLDFDMCKRPWHEKFAKHQRTFGGFPSGHLAEAVYTATLYGLRYGRAYAIPLGGVAVFVTAVFLSSNRHYLSQMVAGAGFGAMYAFSANSLINSRLAKERELNLGLSVNENGGSAMNVSFRF